MGLPNTLGLFDPNDEYVTDDEYIEENYEFQFELADTESEIAAAYTSTIDKEYVDKSYEPTNDGQTWFSAMKEDVGICFDDVCESLERMK